MNQQRVKASKDRQGLLQHQQNEIQKLMRSQTSKQAFQNKTLVQLNFVPTTTPQQQQNQSLNANPQQNFGDNFITDKLQTSQIYQQQQRQFQSGLKKSQRLMSSTLNRQQEQSHQSQPLRIINYPIINQKNNFTQNKAQAWPFGMDGDAKKRIFNFKFIRNNTNMNINNKSFLQQQHLQQNYINNNFEKIAHKRWQTQPKQRTLNLVNHVNQASQLERNLTLINQLPKFQNNNNNQNSEQTIFNKQQNDENICKQQDKNYQEKDFNEMDGLVNEENFNFLLKSQILSSIDKNSSYKNSSRENSAAANRSQNEEFKNLALNLDGFCNNNKCSSSSTKKSKTSSQISKKSNKQINQEILKNLLDPVKNDPNQAYLNSRPKKIQKNNKNKDENQSESNHSSSSNDSIKSFENEPHKVFDDLELIRRGIDTENWTTKYGENFTLFHLYKARYEMENEKKISNSQVLYIMDKLAGQKVRRDVGKYPWKNFYDENHYASKLGNGNGYYLRFYRHYRKYQEEKLKKKKLILKGKMLQSQILPPKQPYHVENDLEDSQDFSLKIDGQQCIKREKFIQDSGINLKENQQFNHKNQEKFTINIFDSQSKLIINQKQEQKKCEVKENSSEQLKEKKETISSQNKKKKNIFEKFFIPTPVHQNISNQLTKFEEITNTKIPQKSLNLKQKAKIFFQKIYKKSNNNNNQLLYVQIVNKSNQQNHMYSKNLYQQIEQKQQQKQEQGQNCSQNQINNENENDMIVMENVELIESQLINGDLQNKINEVVTIATKQQKKINNNNDKKLQKRCQTKPKPRDKQLDSEQQFQSQFITNQSKNKLKYLRV